MTTEPTWDAHAPIVCTIGSDEIPDRIEQLEGMRAALVGVHRTGQGLLLEFPHHDDVIADVRRFCVDEHRCCQFWGFEIGVAPDRATLRWDGPPGAADVLDRLHGYFTGDEPVTEISGLL